MTAPVPGSIKRDPSTGAVAVCTSMTGVDPSGAHGWLCLTTSQGSYYCATDDDDLADWTDLYTA